MPRPFRFKLNSYGKATADEWRGLAQMAEDQGYSTLSISDHTFNPLSPLTALALMCWATISGIQPWWRGRWRRSICFQVDVCARSSGPPIRLVLQF